MKALAILGPGPGNIGIVERTKPVCGPGQVIIAVEVASVCTSDLHMYHGGLPSKPGVVLGHEYTGQIVQAADDLGDWSPGQRVTSELHVGTCGKCYYCRRGNIMMCPRKTPLGWSYDGAFAEYVKIPARLLHRVPDTVSDQMAALTEPIACVLGGVNMLGICEGDFVLVTGAGFIGLAAAKIAKVLGATKVALVGRSRHSTLRLEIARRAGMDMVLDCDRDDVMDEVSDASNSLGANMVIEASGSESALRMAIHAVRRSGKICAIGLTRNPSISVEWNELMKRRVRLAFAWSADSDSFEHTLSLMADKSISFPKELISSFPLDKWRQAFEALEARDILKAQFSMSGVAQPT